MRPVSSWGRLSHDPHHFVSLGDPARVAAALAGDGAPGYGAPGSAAPGLAYGMGRSYGDVCLNPEGLLWCTAGLDHLVAFDEENGRLTCEAGALLGDIQRLCIPRGWMLPVTPGTQWVTVGGAVANDVHGKNHHRRGSFGDHVLRLKLMRTDGEVIECGPDRQADWFAATVGGLGLTGVIVEVEIQLCPVTGPWLDTETLPYAGLAEFFELADHSEADWEYTVSWFDCVSRDARGLFLRANPSAQSATARLPRQLSIPIAPPVSLVNRASLRLFNSAYYHLGRRRPPHSLQHYQAFFYPLDRIHHWNRMYGPRGFFQYQCVVPRESGQDAVQAMLDEIARSGEGSFLAVLKTFGDRQPPGMLSFPMPGVTLALDFPNRGAHSDALFERLDAIVDAAGGRLYMAKDARMPRSLFEAGYPRLPEFAAFRDAGISSALSRRLMGS